MHTRDGARPTTTIVKEPLTNSLTRTRELQSTVVSFCSQSSTAPSPLPMSSVLLEAQRRDRESQKSTKQQISDRRIRMTESSGVRFILFSCNYIIIAMLRKKKKETYVS
uniref:Uncharacterized protein n=1 Tax=Physcomitrium patens TaxID=3218 RepID=A0A2K1KD23_PHYPA|nr:hypothetical protein PHYPA_010870 [Physcomitrium patens]